MFANLKRERVVQARQSKHCVGGSTSRERERERERCVCVCFLFEFCQFVFYSGRKIYQRMSYFVFGVNKFFWGVAEN